MREPLDEETKKHLSRFVDFDEVKKKDEHERTLVRSVMDEIVEETESEEDRPVHSALSS